MSAVIYLAGGCFWGCQKYFDLIPGVLETEVGYANGDIKNPTYEQVKAQGTGHAETVRVAYDPQKVSLRDILQKYFAVIDPFAVDRQGPDIGNQYRTGIYTVTSEDLAEARRALKELEARLGRPVAVEAMPLKCFYPAEEYHQKYLEKHPDGYCHIHFD